MAVVSSWQRVRRNARLRALLGFEETIWTRKVSDTETRRLVAELTPGQLSALEISGARWANAGFRSYRQVGYPTFDICADVLSERFDLIIAEHVLEQDRKSTRLNSSHLGISYAVFCLKKK